MNFDRGKKKISFNLAVDIIELIDQEAKAVVPKLNRTQALEMIIKFYTDNKNRVNQWERLCIALIGKILSICDSLTFFTDKWEINTKDKLYKIKEMADSIPFGFEESGILSGVNLRKSSIPIKEKIDRLFENLEKMER
ncbi:hypothetical protein ES703_29200 [subsurface metagenome]